MIKRPNRPIIARMEGFGHTDEIISQNTFRKKTVSIPFILVVISLIFISFYSIGSAYSISFNAPSVNVNGTGVGPLTDDQIKVSGNNTYLVWTNQTNGNGGKIFFSNSSSNGASFSKPVLLSGGDGQFAKMAISGTHIYVVWKEDATNPFDGTYDIVFTNSTDGGRTFSPIINFTKSLTNADLPQITSNGTKVFLVWNNVTDSNIYFVNGTDDGINGVKFKSEIKKISNTIGGSVDQPRIATSGNHVYVAWQNIGAGTIDVYFSNSTDGGRTFNLPKNLSNIISGHNGAINPQIAVSNNKVYAIWEDDNDTATFNDVRLRVGTDDGSNLGVKFGTLKNLSNSATVASQFPQIAAAGTSVYVIWQEGNVTPDINFVRSIDSGTTFDPVLNLSANSGFSTLIMDPPSPQIAADSSNVYAIWQDDTASIPNNDLFFKASADSGTSFGGVHNLSAGKPSDVNNPIFPSLAASSGNVYVAWIHTIPGTLTGSGDVFFRLGTPSASSTSITFDREQYRLSEPASVRIFAPGFNSTSLSTLDSIIANMSSSTDSTGFGKTLTETSFKSANFSGSLHFHIGNSNPSNATLQSSPGDTITASFDGQLGTAFIYPRIVSFDFGFYTIDKNATVTITDQNSNINSSSIDTINAVNIKSTSDPVGLTFTIPETAVNSGTFSKTIGLSQSYTSGTTLKVTVGDTITATFLGKTGTATIIPGAAPGGGGGGLIRPGFVLDAAGGGYIPANLLNIIQSLDPSKTIMPSYDTTIDFPFSIDGKGFALAYYSNKIMTNIIPTGRSIPLGVVFYSPRDVVHVGLYLDLHSATSELQDSDTYILYDSGQPLQIIDPHGFLSDVKVSVSKNDFKKKFNYYVAFAKPMAKSDIIIRVWDDIHRARDTKILDAVQVIQGENGTQPSQLLGPTTNAANPSPLQNQEQEIDSAIKKWGGYSPESISDSQLLATIGVNGSHIPSWVTKTTKWVVNGNIGVKDFEEIIKYLAHERIIK